MKKRKTRESHGMSNTKVYRAWADMINRCENPNAQEFFRYGGRGITVCEKWKTSFLSFLDEMGQPGFSQSLDRIDPNDGYKKENCRWTCSRTQSINQRMPTTNKSGFKGIKKISEKAAKPWRVQISAKNKTYHIGYFESIEEAIKARKEAEQSFHDDKKTEQAIQQNKRFNKDYCNGVNWNRKKQEFQSRIQINKTAVHLGFFESLLDAAAARKSAELKSF